MFLRNLSFDSEEQDLRDLMQENFGAVLFARLVRDKETELPRGTAFVKFRVSNLIQVIEKKKEGGPPSSKGIETKLSVTLDLLKED